MKIGCRAGFPETYTTGEKTVTYSFEQDSQLIKMNFNLAVEAYQPCFDESMSVQSENKIENFAFDPDVFNAGVTRNNKQVSIKFKDFDVERYYAAGQTITLEWEVNSNTSDVYTVLLYYITPDGDRHIIDCSMRQHNFYDWIIPETISNFQQPNITLIENEITAKTNPHIVVIPESTGYVNTGSFGIIEPGTFSKDGYMQVSLEYIDASSNVKVYDGYIAEVTKDEGVKQIYYYKDLPEVQFEMMNTKRLKYKKGTFGTEITVGIAYPNNMEIKDEISNLLII
jgi:hypothetical protein